MDKYFEFSLNCQVERLTNQGSLGGIDALLGCPLHLPSSKVEPSRTSVVTSCFFVSISSLSNNIDICRTFLISIAVSVLYSGQTSSHHSLFSLLLVSSYRGYYYFIDVYWYWSEIYEVLDGLAFMHLLFPCLLSLNFEKHLNAGKHQTNWKFNTLVCTSLFFFFSGQST